MSVKKAAALASELSYFVSKGWDNGVSRYQLHGRSSGAEYFSQLSLTDDDLVLIEKGLRSYVRENEK